MPDQDKYLFKNNEHFELVLKGLNAGVYEYYYLDGNSWWSSKFYELLGYKRGDIPSNKQTMFDHLIHTDDYSKLASALEDSRKNKKAFSLEIRLKHRSGEYRWYNLSGQGKWENGKAFYLVGAITDIDERVKSLEQNRKYEFLLEEIGQIAKVGGWEVFFEPFQATMSKEMALIHDFDPENPPEFEEVMQHVKAEYRELVSQAFDDASKKGTPYDIELQIITAKAREIWVRVIGKPIYDEHHQKVIGVKGTFQDIDEQKQRELALQASFNLIDNQNKRLNNFTHIISHNLRSYSNNLALTTSLLAAETDPLEIKQLTQNLSSISRSLSETLKHLNEIILNQSENKDLQVPVKFETVLANTMAALKTQIQQTGTVIKSDFSLCQKINYIPAYLESIFLNLISNAIKYRKPDTTPEISISTKIAKGKTILTVQDNGLGIDMVKYGDKLFGMYKTFHEHPDAKGIGLFITRNQIESLGGKITAESRVNQGTTFTVLF